MKSSIAHEMTPREVKQRLDAGDNLLLIDVREPEEVQMAAIEGAKVYPLSQSRDWIDQLPKDQAMVVFCHHGVRSRQVALALRQRGHTNVANMSGGIDQWSAEVDPSVPTY